MNHVTKYFAQIEPDQPLKSPNVFDVALGKLGPGKIIQVSTKIQRQKLPNFHNFFT